jgi:hypothetical protein
MNRVLPAQGGKRGVLEALKRLDGRPWVKFRRPPEKFPNPVRDLAAFLCLSRYRKV